MLLSCKLEVTFKALTRIANQFDFKDITFNFNPKRVNLASPCGFSKIVFFRQKMKTVFFVTFNSSYHKSGCSLYFSMLANFISFLDFWYYFVTNKVMASHITNDVNVFLPSIYSKTGCLTVLQILLKLD